MHYRIGVNLGDVIEEADGTLYGDGVNVAARLESVAESQRHQRVWEGLRGGRRQGRRRIRVRR
jgi:class 3 adenylate cyclase